MTTYEEKIEKLKDHKKESTAMNVKKVLLNAIKMQALSARGRIKFIEVSQLIH